MDVELIEGSSSSVGGTSVHLKGGKTRINRFFPRALAPVPKAHLARVEVFPLIDFHS